ncbi:SUKH-4 family immunity protein [Streptomyces sp. NBC_01474]|uniref:SUKH-4 family immunity protein n=1 Tax=unclassified Streptomyces TaxID=2593676 RepID=UPI002DDBCE5D|nr:MULTISPECIES: SUKH-4 family immunity protein [unclassified Streptomyces]WSD95443.1 SUKH-4 family immunity protein [Streptomyces sp. NBC_01474]
MASHGELVEIFGESNIEKMGYREALRIGLDEEDALVLSHVGLPRNCGALFTTEVDASPPLFTVRNFSDDGSNRAVILGGPRDDPKMRYFLNVRDRFVGLIALRDEPRGEVVNSTLADFVEFLYHIARRDVSPAPASAAEGVQDADQLAEILIDRDPHAFREPDTWWSIALTQIREHEEGS